jgi:hypothetical protein
VAKQKHKEPADIALRTTTKVVDVALAEIGKGVDLLSGSLTERRRQAALRHLTAALASLSALKPVLLHQVQECVDLRRYLQAEIGRAARAARQAEGGQRDPRHPLFPPGWSSGAAEPPRD